MNDKLTEIMNGIIADNEYQVICRKYSPNDNAANELYQEFVLTIMEYKNQDKLWSVHQKGQMRYFGCAIIRTMATSSTSPYYKKIRQFNIDTYDIDEQWNIADESEEHTDSHDMTDVLEKLLADVKVVNNYLNESKDIKGYYRKRIFELYYYDNKTYRQIEKETDILHVSIFKNIKSTIKKIKNNVTIIPFK